MMKGFSLIELMVVIAIIALLAAVAVPVYKVYSIKSKISSPFNIISKAALDVMSEYQTRGVWPTSISIGGGGAVTLGSWQDFNFAGIRGIAINTSAYPAVMIQATLSGLQGIPGYQDPGSGNYNNALASSITYSVRDNGKTLKVACGSYNPAYVAYDIPYSYLPTICSCADINAFISVGSTSTC